MLTLVTDQVVSRVMKSRFSSIEEAQANPAQAQRRAFAKLQAQLKGTQIARLTGLNRCEDYDAFIRAAQERTYDDYSLLVEMTLEGGAKKLLFNDRPQYVGLSSGTTGHNSKRIVYNKQMAHAFTDFQLSIGAILQNSTDYSFVRHPRLTWGSSPVVETTEDGVECGYISGFLSTHAHPASRKMSFPSVAVGNLTDMPEKIRLAGEQLKNQDLRLISGVPSYIVNLLEELKALWGIENFSAIWPNLATVVYSGTGIDSYRQRLMELIGHPVQFLGVYISTEGPFGYEIPKLNGGENGVYSFHLGELVYSFKRINGTSDAFIGIADLKIGDEVELFISSPNGLIHYKTGDCLKIRSTAPLLFEILGRVGHGVNVAAEKVTLSQLSRTAARVADVSKMTLRHFFVTPGESAHQKPCYDWILLVDDPQAVKVAEVTRLLDDALMAQNSDYKENRLDLGFLDRPNVRVLGASLAHQYFEKASHRGQLKMKMAFDSKEKFQAFLADMGLSLAEAV